MLNINHIRKTQTYIRVNISNYNQDRFTGEEFCIGGAAIRANGEIPFYHGCEAHVLHQASGWARKLELSEEYFSPFAAYAHQLLGLPAKVFGSGDNAINLFGTGQTWPEPFKSRFLAADNSEDKALVAIDLLDWVVEQYGDTRPSVTLTLSAREADALYTVLHRISGAGSGEIFPIYRALDTADRRDLLSLGEWDGLGMLEEQD